MAKLSEIAGKFGVSKSTVRRAVAEVCPELLGRGGVIELDVNQASAVADYLKGRFGSGERFSMNRNELSSSCDDSVGEQFTSVHVERLEAVNEQLVKRIDDLESQVAELREDKKVLQGLLAAEQRNAAMAGGFWRRLGQRLLGDGRTEREN